MSDFLLKFLGGSIAQHQIDAPASRDRFRALLAENHKASVPVFCHCHGDASDPLKLSVVLSETFFLRRYPGTAHLHNADCLFSAEVDRPPSTDNRNVPGVLRDESGRLKIALDPHVFPLRRELREEKAEASPTTPEEKDGRDRSGATRGSITLLGILRVLLEEAGMAEWKPYYTGLRSRQRFLRRLHAVAYRTVFGRGFLLSDIIAWPNEAVGVDELMAYCAKSPIKGPRGEREILVLGELLNVKLSSTGKSMVMRLDWFRMPFICDLRSWPELEAENERALSRDTEGNLLRKVWALLTVRMVDGKNGTAPFFWVKACAATLLTSQMIPVESAYEATAAEHLVDQGRAFDKPLRYRAGDAMFPDFILRDTVPPTHFEVWGMTDPDYEKRRREKVNLCLQNKIPLVEWDAAADAPFPNLPAKTQFAPT